MIAGLKPYPAYQHSGVEWLREVPDHWEVRQLGQIGKLSKGSGGSKDDECSDGIPCVRYGDLYTAHDFFIRASRSFVSADRAKDYTSIRFGDVLFAGSGETIDEIGKSAINLMTEDACCGGDVIVFRATRQIEARFLGYATDCRCASAQKATMGRGITVMHLYGSQLKRLSLSLPPLSEQAAIARFLDHADRRIRRAIRVKEKRIALLQEERRIATRDALNSPGATAQRLESVTQVVQRPVDRACGKECTPIGIYNRGRGFFRKPPRFAEDLGDSRFFWIESGDFVISGQFAWEGAIGLAGNEEDGCVASHRYPILRGTPGTLHSGFLFAFFQSDWGRLLLDHHSRGAAGRNRPLKVKSLLKEKISVPSLSAQHRLVSLLQREQRTRQHVARWSALLSEYRARLIADVVTGKLDVRDAAATLPDIASA